MRLRLRVVAATVTIAASAMLLATTAPASAAEPTAQDKASARAMLVDGYRELERGEGGRALELFRAADALMNVPTTKLAVARAQVKLGRLVDAEMTLLGLLRLPEHADDPPPYAKARSDARVLLDDVAARVPELTLKGVPDDAPVKIDELTVPRASLAGPRRLDPGHHVVLVGAKRFDIDLAERDKKSLDVSTAAGSITRIDPPAPAPADKPRPEPTGGGTNVLAIAGFAVAGAGVVTGSITGLLAIGKKSDADEYCRDNQCPPEANADLDAAGRFATISTIAFIVGAVGIGVGIYGLVSGSGGGTTTATTTATAPARRTIRFGPSGVEARF